MADGTFSPLAPGNSRVGPNSNTGQKSSLTAPILDFCTMVFDSEKAIALLRKLPMTEVLRYVFSTGQGIAVGPLQERPWNFYPRSATMVDATGSVCGKIGVADDGKVCISLTGQGCQWVSNWRYVHQIATDLEARITRLDIAVDDLTGEIFDIHHFKNLHAEGAFMLNGRPPTASFVDDLGSNKGCSLYIGQKGHKQLNVYEKGKQLGDPDSGHTRCELRLYAKRLDLPLDALINPGKYFAGAYPLLAAFVLGEAERLQVKERMVNASVKAMVRFLRNQAGNTLNLVMDALGEEACIELMKEHINRSGRPGRFKNVTGDLTAHVRAQLQTIQSQEAA